MVELMIWTVHKYVLGSLQCKLELEKGEEGVNIRNTVLILGEANSLSLFVSCM